MNGARMKHISEFYSQFSRAVIAGICIGIGGFINLKLGGIAGAVFFAFGLLIVICEKYNLFTGIAGTTQNIYKLAVSLFGNIVGCFTVASLARVTSPDIMYAAAAILDTRLAAGPFAGFLMSIPCGFIVTAAVRQARAQNMYYPVFLGVPIFILCGFPHCVADAFNYLACPAEYLMNNWWMVCIIYLLIVFGNYIGCNLYRIVPKNKTL